MVELLFSVAILIIVLVAVAAILSEISKIWTQRQAQIQRQQNGRVLLDFIARDIEKAMLPLSLSATNSLQFVINSPMLSGSYGDRDNIFFQAPIAADQSAGEVAEVGYFVQYPANGAPQLCRFFVGPTTTASNNVTTTDTNYQIYSAPDAWISPTLVGNAVPAVAATTGTNYASYKGLLAEDVAGLWISAFDGNGNFIGNPSTRNSYDSRSTANLPAMVEISLLVLDANTARRLESGGASSSSALAGTVLSSTSAAQCMTELPAVLQQGASCFTTEVWLRNTQ